MLRRFRLSRGSAERTGIGDCTGDVLEYLRQRLVDRGAYLASRGFVSTAGDGDWRTYVGQIVNIRPKSPHWVVDVETCADYEARQHEVVDAATQRRRGRQDADAVDEAIAAELDASISRELSTRDAQRSRRLIPSRGSTLVMQGRNIGTADIGMSVYSTDGASVTMSPSSHAVRVGTLVSVEADGNVIVALGDNATARDVAEAVSARRGHSVMMSTPMQTIASLEYRDVASNWDCPPMPIGVTQGSYTADFNFRSAFAGLRSAFHQAVETVDRIISEAIVTGRSREDAINQYRSILDEAQTTPQSVEEVAARRRAEAPQQGGRRADLLIIDDVLETPHSARHPVHFPISADEARETMRSALNIPTRDVPTLETTSSARLDEYALTMYGATRQLGETDEAFRQRCRNLWFSQAQQPQSTRRHIAAVEVEPDDNTIEWLPRLLPWLGCDVEDDDAGLRALCVEVGINDWEGSRLVYVPERQALRVTTWRELQANDTWRPWNVIYSMASARKAYQQAAVPR